MSSVSAREALEYATRDEMLKLYGVFVAGWIATIVGRSLLGVVGTSVLSLVGLVVSLAGVLAVLVSVVAIAHKLLAES